MPLKLSIATAVYNLDEAFLRAHIERICAQLTDECELLLIDDCSTNNSGEVCREYAAANEGVDSCWLNYFDPDKAAKALGMPNNEEVLMLLDLGYAADGSGPLPNHDSRKPLNDTVTYL